MLKKIKKIYKDWRWTMLLGSAIFVLAFFLRAHNLTELPIFGDEAIYVRWAQVMRAEPTLRFLPLSDGKQPLFMWSVMPMLKIFSDPLVAGRFVSVLTGMGTLVGVFTASYLLFNSKRAGLLASFFYAISPFSVFFDRMALVDSMLAFFAIWTFIFSLITVKTKRLDSAMVTGFFLGGALLTKSPGVFVAAMIPVVFLLTKWPKNKKKTSVQLIKLASLFVPTYLIAYGMYNILRLGPNFHLLSSRTLDYVHPISHLFDSPLDPLMPYLDRSLEYFWIMGPGLIVIFVLLAIFINRKKKIKELMVLSIWILVPVFITSEFSKTMTARYIYYTVPFVFVLASSVVLVKKGFLQKLIVVGILLHAFFALRFNHLLITNIQAAPLPRGERAGYLEEWTAGGGIKEVASDLKDIQRENPDRKIVVGTEGFFGTLPDGLQIYLADAPEITVIGVGLNIDKIPDSLRESEEAGNMTFLVVNSSRLKGDPDKMGLELISAYPKAFRPDGIREYVQHGPRDNLYLFEVK